MGANEKHEATYGGGCTPTTEQIRNEFIDFQPGPGICSWDEGSARRFDRWLEQVRAEAKAAAYEYAANRLLEEADFQQDLYRRNGRSEFIHAAVRMTVIEHEMRRFAAQPKETP